MILCKKSGIVIWIIVLCVGNIVPAQEDKINQYIYRLHVM
jgi:hypothetical protein